MDWKSLAAGIAPALSTAFLGPEAGLAVSALERAFGLTDSTPDEDREALKGKIVSGDPETLAVIRKADNDFRLAMEQLGVEQYRIDAEDRASAREREVRVGGKIVEILASGVLLIYAVLSIASLLGWFPQTVEPTTVASVMSAWAGAVMLVLSYFFGSAHKKSGE